MTQLTRRQMLVGTAAVAVAAAVPFVASSPVGAAAPAIARLSVCFHHRLFLQRRQNSGRMFGVVRQARLPALRSHSGG